MNVESLVRYAAPPLIVFIVWLLSLRLGLVAEPPSKHANAWSILAMATPALHLMQRREHGIARPDRAWGPR